jgi:ERCC4-related helicase
MWQDQRIWDAALKNIRIVISTHAILQDALEHSFVGMSRISLLIFDEGRLTLLLLERVINHVQSAHHCVENHPGAQIMKNSYFHNWNQGRSDPLPRILGLTASPVSPRYVPHKDIS